MKRASMPNLRKATFSWLYVCHARVNEWYTRMEERPSTHPAVEMCTRDDVVARLRQRRERKQLRRLTRSGRHSRNTAFQRRHAFLKHVLHAHTLVSASNPSRSPGIRHVQQWGSQSASRCCRNRAAQTGPPRARSC